MFSSPIMLTALAPWAAALIALFPALIAGFVAGYLVYREVVRRRMGGAKAESERMIEDVIRDEPRMTVNTLEVSSDKPSYSIETLQTLASQFPHDERFYLIGADQWENFHTWKNWEQLFDLATLVVFSRSQKLQQTSPLVSQFLQNKHPKVVFLEMPQCPVSSSKLRNKIEKEGVDSEYCRQWLMPSTREYLRRLGSSYNHI